MIPKNNMLFIKTLAEEANQETVSYIMEGMQKTFGEQCPDSKAVVSYLKDTESSTTLTTKEQLIVIHKLLEVSEINFRTMCDLMRYQMFRAAGIVKTMDEFLELLNPAGKP